MSARKRQGNTHVGSAALHVAIPGWLCDEGKDNEAEERIKKGDRPETLARKRDGERAAPNGFCCVYSKGPVIYIRGLLFYLRDAVCSMSEKGLIEGTHGRGVESLAITDASHGA